MLNKLLWPSRLALPLLLLTACATQGIEPAPTHAAVQHWGAVSSADPRASAAGREVLQEGGTAADAAMAMMLALTVVEPQSSGIGGGGFLVHHDGKSGEIETIDGREAAPAAATPTYFYGPSGQPLAHSDAVPGGKSVGVPGNIRLMEMAHAQHGRLAWAKLFEPAIRLARDGFAITPRMRNALASGSDLATMTPWARGHFFDSNGQPKPVGTVLRNPDLAKLLETLAERGPDYFYVGPQAQAVVGTVRTAARNPSLMTAGDMAAYHAKERPPVCGVYRGYRICGMGPPSSGATTVFAILKQLERFNLAALGPDSPEAWHLIGESMRLAYADRDSYLADPDFIRVPVAGLTDPAYLASRSQLIARDRTIAHVTAGTPSGAPRVTAAISGEVPSTSHFVAVDSTGNVATMTSTIEGVWGSGLTVNGYFLNNELTDFSLAPELDGAPVANRVEGGKRPRSSMAPTIVYAPDGSVRMALGAAGGSTIIAQIAKAIIGVVDWKMSAQQAIALPQLIGMGDRLTVERKTSLEAMAPALRALGHEVVAVDPGYKANAVERVGGRWVGAADPRSEGVALTE